MKNLDKVSGLIVVHNEGKIIKEALESLKGQVDEIIVIHDGNCSDNTLKIAKGYTKKVYTTKYTGRSAFNFIKGVKKSKYSWILKIDADESLSPELGKNIKKLIKNREADAYSFIHPLWDGKKSITKTWPRKTSLARKSKISYLAFPGFDMNIPIKGNTKKTDYILFHKPLKNQDIGWEGFKEKVLKKYAKNQVKYLLMDFKDIDTFQYVKKDLPLKIRIRRRLPLITNTLYAILVLLKQLIYEGAYREGFRGLQVVSKTFIYNTYLGYLIYKEKRNRRSKK